jgi:hypothetical protein
MTVHIGHSTVLGGVCGRGSPKGERDIVVSQRTFFREVATAHRCAYCIRTVYVMTSGPEADPLALDDTED